jgi:hypothetical protein
MDLAEHLVGRRIDQEPVDDHRVAAGEEALELGLAGDHVVLLTGRRAALADLLLRRRVGQARPAASPAHAEDAPQLFRIDDRDGDVPALAQQQEQPDDGDGDQRRDRRGTRGLESPATIWPNESPPLRSGSGIHAIARVRRGSTCSQPGSTGGSGQAGDAPRGSARAVSSIDEARPVRAAATSLDAGAWASSASMTAIASSRRPCDAIEAGQVVAEADLILGLARRIESREEGALGAGGVARPREIDGEAVPDVDLDLLAFGQRGLDDAGVGLGRRRRLAGRLEQTRRLEGRLPQDRCARGRGALRRRARPADDRRPGGGATRRRSGRGGKASAAVHGRNGSSRAAARRRRRSGSSVIARSSQGPTLSADRLGRAGELRLEPAPGSRRAPGRDGSASSRPGRARGSAPPTTRTRRAHPRRRRFEVEGRPHAASR